MSKLWSLVLAFTFVAFVSAVFAADPPKKGEGQKRPDPKEIFKKLDKDGNGALTVEELASSRRFNGDKAKAEESLKKMDENKDGTVCVVEFTNAFAKRHAEHKKEGAKAGEKKECPKGEKKA